ncbi:hypothetical protein GWK47_003075 [Chionoecetes opilio]|uniref:Uncharacterized protein n=1 Tax=Chionoecetes opilio TaxID=41210 RepID=A0A8J8WL61_CHIOP|nr:hypothetical protein GWK47_003075 [Chionoecetes opilio]
MLRCTSMMCSGDASCNMTLSIDAHCWPNIFLASGSEAVSREATGNPSPPAIFSLCEVRAVVKSMQDPAKLPLWGEKPPELGWISYLEGQGEKTAVPLRNFRAKKKELFLESLLPFCVTRNPLCPARLLHKQQCCCR